MLVKSVPAKDFKLIFDQGNFYRCKKFNLKVHRLNDDKDTVYFGAVISKKKDKLAVHRNRTRRLLREALRLSNLAGLGGMAFVFIPNEKGMGKSLVEYQGEIEDILKVINK
ncbi:ribonuclease P protein component [candidate division WWE3 bacterium RIFCSPLOWO2_01_FULL_42_11]|uniref:Ribonuclease P protein component n=1 Tax=candidate division WWE3 bacterium RIFCSPLOWO2_01_FULL_42_11 TaxID=1802627 RepID=A0A1F4VMX4_UNCKA|nr:MAG: ribonuclease P protein component [candidate division WWE3 bacterium RIFCSPLOWO2_01_FULL_42_11]